MMMKIIRKIAEEHREEWNDVVYLQQRLQTLNKCVRIQFPIIGRLFYDDLHSASKI